VSNPAVIHLEVRMVLQVATRLGDVSFLALFDRSRMSASYWGKPDIETAPKWSE
jgi:hypothetical protein